MGILTSCLTCFLARFIPKGRGSPRSMHDSTIFLATSWAISIVSAMVRPWAIKPWNSSLVAKYPPSSRASIFMEIKNSDILFSWRYSNTGSISEQSNDGHLRRIQDHPSVLLIVFDRDEFDAVLTDMGKEFPKFH